MTINPVMSAPLTMSVTELAITIGFGLTRTVAGNSGRAVEAQNKTSGGKGCFIGSSIAGLYAGEEGSAIIAFARVRRFCSATLPTTVYAGGSTVTPNRATILVGNAGGLCGIGALNRKHVIRIRIHLPIR